MAQKATPIYMRVLRLQRPIPPRASAAICRNVAKTVQGALSWQENLSGALTTDYRTYSLRIVSSAREPAHPKLGLYLPCKITATLPLTPTFDFDMAISDLGACLGSKIEHVLQSYGTDDLRVRIEGRPLAGNLASIVVKLQRHDHPGQLIARKKIG